MSASLRSARFVVLASLNMGRFTGRGWSSLLLLAGFIVASSATVTLPNHGLKFDTKGDLIDAHDGKMYYFEDRYYFYGTAYNCGFRWR